MLVKFYVPSQNKMTGSQKALLTYIQMRYPKSRAVGRSENPGVPVLYGGHM